MTCLSCCIKQLTPTVGNKWNLTPFRNYVNYLTTSNNVHVCMYVCAQLGRWPLMGEGYFFGLQRLAWSLVVGTAFSVHSQNCSYFEPISCWSRDCLRKTSWPVFSLARLIWSFSSAGWPYRTYGYHWCEMNWQDVSSAMRLMEAQRHCELFQLWEQMY